MLLNAILDFVLVFEVFLALTTLRFQGNKERKNAMAIKAVSTTRSWRADVKELDEKLKFAEDFIIITS